MMMMVMLIGCVDEDERMAMLVEEIGVDRV